MNPIAKLLPDPRRRKGLALVTVIALLALAMVLLLALFASTQTELKATVSATDGAFARQQADAAVNLVIGQIKRATHQNDAVAGREIWTSQPGLIRQYREDGTLLVGNKLYSDGKMSETSEAAIGADTPPTDWDTQPERYVDMNEPAARQDMASGTPRMIFPIIDPRAYNVDGSGSADVTRSVEGFSYSSLAKGGIGASTEALNGVVLPSGSNADAQRLPMPVEWIYVLKDGTLGCLDETNTFAGASGEIATINNPMVSRIAFWTDDESSKININTAGEGTYWDTPRMLHERDADWAIYQPMTYEYQRYPGHPASVSMSAVLFPGLAMNSPRTSADFAASLKVKESIYEIMPKILSGGSKAGSVPILAGQNFTPTDFANVQKALGERLFATVDDFLLQPQLSGGRREEISLGSAPGAYSMWSAMPKAEVIERLRFFLTPNSRAPETNPFGLPKISMWPVSVETGADYRTVYDRTLVHAATLAGRPYYFTRQYSHRQDELDAAVNPRNNALYEYLKALTAAGIPGFGGDFLTKYGENRDQILVDIFDYIRTTNIFDDSLAERNVGTDPAITSAPAGRLNAYEIDGGRRSKTFTPMRKAVTNNVGSWPGTGQVVPTAVDRGNGEKYRGMGRFSTISEVGVHFICCAEGTDRAGGAYAPKIGPSNGSTFWKAGGWSDADNWYSNFPPLTDVNAAKAGGFYSAKYPDTQGKTGNGIEGGRAGTDASHPGYHSRNWNWCLDKDAPLPANTKRLQANFLLEWFIPTTGLTWIDPDFQIEIDAGGLTVDGGKPLFPKNNGVTVIKPYHMMANAFGVYQRGGTNGYRSFLSGGSTDSRKLPEVIKGAAGFQHGSMPADAGYATAKYPGTILENCHRYNLVSDFFDVPSSAPISFDGGTVVVKIMATSSTNAPVFQTLHFKFPAGAFKAPELVKKTHQNSSGWNTNVQAVPPFYWWSFHSDGALGRSNDGVLAGSNQDYSGGRLRYVYGAQGYEIDRDTDTIDANPISQNHRRGNLVVAEDTLQTLVIRHGDPRLIMARSDVPDTEFVPHRLYGRDRRIASNLILAYGNATVNADRGTHPAYPIPPDKRFIYGAVYQPWQMADIPLPLDENDSVRSAVRDVNKYRDFDRGGSTMEDGAYVNKPDDGNTHVEVLRNYTIPYFSRLDLANVGGGSYFSPNRQVASPGMFGSLPTGAWGVADASGGLKQEGWRTLLFRPQTWMSGTADADKHPGAPSSLRWSNTSSGGLQSINVHGVTPPDYLFMDFFWMPVVEPYAISEPGSTAGKVNINYQMAPFRHIRRATALAAVLKSEMIHAIPQQDAGKYIHNEATGYINSSYTYKSNIHPLVDHNDLTYFWKEGAGTYGDKFWHRQIDVEATLKLFDERLASGFAFISPAQICEMHLLPKKGGYIGAPQSTVNRDNAAGSPPATWPTTMADLQNPDKPDSIMAFWQANAVTAENLREKPYTNIYPKLTTRSNTFQVHVRTQVIKKARSADADKFIKDKDSIAAEYRGSAIIERYLDQQYPGQGGNPSLDSFDYAAGSVTTHPPLDHYHRFRILSQKRFN